MDLLLTVGGIGFWPPHPTPSFAGRDRDQFGALAGRPASI